MPISCRGIQTSFLIQSGFKFLLIFFILTWLEMNELGLREKLGIVFHSLKARKRRKERSQITKIKINAFRPQTNPASFNPSHQLIQSVFNSASNAERKQDLILFNLMALIEAGISFVCGRERKKPDLI